MERDRWLSVVLRTALLVLFVWMIRTILVPIALGGLFALLLSPLAEKVKPRLGRAEPLTPLLFTFGTIILVVIPFAFITVEAIQSINDFLARDWTPTIQRFQSFLTEGIDIRGRSIHIGGPQLQLAIQNIGQRAASFAASFVGGMATALPAFILSLFLFGVSLYYFLRDGGKLVRWMFRLSPFPPSQTRELFASVRETVNGAILGILATAVVQGSLTLLALHLFGVPNAFLLGVLAALLSFIPLVGTTPVTVGATIYLFVTNHVGGAIGMGISAVLIGLSDNVVRPWVQSSSTRMHPLIALLGIFGGLDLFGPVGVFLGPVIAAMAVWTVDTYAKLHHASRREATTPPVDASVPPPENPPVP
ncbi:AI-2E family transporter [Polyangium sorediatum]|uniref:AI-2E family transporter n=1 Tax=Polyangium sorediatum TaxID=889274 RepID=A0ABT6P9G2_9BACT|nr:AI-2E family transporter [Polyangium sorediatum]MDI1437257.1 AI-2E family transporter [Polyangium sorediatum]